uniref:Putative ribonuclease H-like domain-containing protein n=1 Tax=Tanacetum cinerariifolium TaxID=118510 RepID=A0A6L2L4Q4_TANCI|nr:putative ribonuclease H-like domain-containing protein [Tanacetum cinerariifolium]
MGLPNEHQLKFNSFKDAKTLLEAIENGLVGVNTANKVNAASSLNIDNPSDTVIYGFLASQPNSTHLVNEDLEQIHPDDLEKIDLKWQMAMLTMKSRRILKYTGKKLNLNENDSVAFDKTKVEYYNYHKRCHFTRECQAPRRQDNMSLDVTRETVPAEEGPTNYALMAYSTSLASSSDSEMSNDEDEEVEKKEVKPSINRINFVKATIDNNPKETAKNDEQPKQNTHGKRVVNAAKEKAKHNVVKEKRGNVVKALACWGNPQENLQDKEVMDSGCSRHMTGNMFFLIDYEEIDEGYVAFGRNHKRGKITSKGKIKIRKLDFENVYFVRELKFNLFRVSQICDKKNSVFFINTECIVLSPDFKLIDENQILLRVPRQNNMYNIDLKNIVPTRGLTCVFSKATKDESKLWHRRLGHLNFKTINKLVKGNLVRGLPSKIFENDQSCVACPKGKQYIASCKTKVENSINTPLHLLHMDLFGPKFIKSINKKMYCLVVTDDCSRFTWVFFLGTKDETSCTLKSFITRVENLMNLMVKVIRCDNGTEFKNREMNQFCEVKGITRQYSVARTPQQIGVAERRNKTLIEATKTMLVDSKMPTTFWAEAVNTACYEKEPDRDYILLPLWTADSPFSTISKSSQDNEFQPSNDGAKKVDEDRRKENECNDKGEKDSTNRVNTVTLNINAASSSEVNVVGTNISINLSTDPNMPSLEDIGIFKDSHDD